MPPDFDRSAFCTRILHLRREVYGEDGVAHLARKIGIPRRTWMNYERGVVMPDVVLLRFMGLTGADPGWLLTGKGEPSSAPARPVIEIVDPRD